MAPRKSRKCTVCREVFQRPHNVTMHMKTAHRNYVEKLVCTVCKTLVSTMSNMRVHLSREGKRNNKTYELRKGKIDGQRIEHVWVPATSMSNGRYKESYSSDDSSVSDTDNAPLAALANKGSLRFGFYYFIIWVSIHFLLFTLSCWTRFYEMTVYVYV